MPASLQQLHRMPGSPYYPIREKRYMHLHYLFLQAHCHLASMKEIEFTRKWLRTLAPLPNDLHLHFMLSGHERRTVECIGGLALFRAEGSTALLTNQAMRSPLAPDPSPPHDRDFNSNSMYMHEDLAARWNS